MSSSVGKTKRSIPFKTGYCCVFVCLCLGRPRLWPRVSLDDREKSLYTIYVIRSVSETTRHDAPQMSACNDRRRHTSPTTPSVHAVPSACVRVCVLANMCMCICTCASRMCTCLFIASNETIVSARCTPCCVYPCTSLLLPLSTKCDGFRLMKRLVFIEFCLYLFMNKSRNRAHSAHS